MIPDSTANRTREVEGEADATDSRRNAFTTATHIKAACPEISGILFISMSGGATEMVLTVLEALFTEAKLIVEKNNALDIFVLTMV